MKYRAYTTKKLREIKKYRSFTDEQFREMEVVANVLPFKSNNYVVEQLIDWNNVPNDPIFRLTFPQKDMLLPHHFEKMDQAMQSTSSKRELKLTADEIRRDLNPHPAGQKAYNIPIMNNQLLKGIQHKYRETMLFFPSHGQTCHSYCSFCFRWPQFINLDDEKIAMGEVDLLIEYLENHPRVTDVLFTGGDPMTMKPELLSKYIQPLLDANIKTLKTIRLGSKSLAFWPYKYTEGVDAENTLALFSEVTDRGYNLSFMAHFNHYQELKTPVLKEAVSNILKTGVQIRTQSPVLKHINASSEVWSTMWREQVNLGMIPYYMFVVRDTGAQHYFNITLEHAHKIFTDAYTKVSGVCRTVRGPSMSTNPGKIEISGIAEVNGEKAFVLRFIQGRDPKWVNQPFFAKYDAEARWLDDLTPLHGDKFFYENDLNVILEAKQKEHVKLEKTDINSNFIDINQVEMTNQS